MSAMWKGKFFLQTGLPESLPRAPTVLCGADYAPISESDKKKRRKEKSMLTGCRGKDRAPRRARVPILFNFFEAIQGVEAKDGSVQVCAANTKRDFAALTNPERAHWEFMHELFRLYRTQQNEVRVTEFRSTSKHKMQKILLSEFYHLSEPAQQQLVRDTLAVRWHRENEVYAKQMCEQHDRNLMTDVRKDVADILLKIDVAMGHTLTRAYPDDAV